MRDTSASSANSYGQFPLRSIAPSTPALVHSLFEEQVQRTPDAVAVTFQAACLTYGQLNEKSSRLAAILRNRGVGPDRPVGICAERGLDMVVGLVGILKAGGAYLPLDPNYPRDRLQYMLADAGPTLVLTQEKLQTVLPPADADLIMLDSLELSHLELGEIDLPGLHADLSGKNLVYVIYTSGSTGRPKGTGMPHRSMVNLIRWHRSTFAPNENARVLQFAALSFDVAFQEIFSTLCTGGTLVLLPERVRRDARALIELLRDQRVERLFIPPLMLQSLAESSLATRTLPESLQDVITAGEQLRISAEISEFFQLLPKCQLHNHYGPTETHVVTALTLDGHPENWPELPSIGRPITNARIYILDDQRHAVPIGDSGEIYISGDVLARGYLGRPELTSQRFLRDPFAADLSDRMYKTGDVGRWLADGTIQYLGRNDDQLKIRGFRIEPGEIEAELRQIANIKDAAVVAHEDSAGSKRLVAYVIRRDYASEQSAEFFRSHLKTALPEHMIPSAFVVLNRFPLSPNGKLDRRALPAPDPADYVSRDYETPVDDLEETVAGTWRTLLHVERISRNDNLFELGGDSIVIVRMIERLQRAGINVDVQSVYANPVLKHLCATLRDENVIGYQLPPNLIPKGSVSITPQMLPLVQLDEENIERIVGTVPGGARNVEDIYPLTPLQEGMLFHHLLNNRTDTYVLPILISFSSREILGHFLDAVQRVIERHDTLRTAVLWDKLPQPVQVVYRSAQLTIEEVELDVDNEVDDQLSAWLKPEQQRLTLSQAPLMRLKITGDRGRSTWYALLQLHHLICDHVALEMLLEELMSHVTGAQHQLPAPVPYRNHVAHTLARSKAVDSHAFFRHKLADVGEPTLPFGLLDIHGDSLRVATAQQDLAVDLAQEIRAVARNLGTSPATLFHSAWALVVSHTSGRDDVVFGTLLSGRLQGAVGAQHALGMLINTLPLRLRLRGITTGNLITQCQREITELVAHEHASLAIAQRCSDVDASQPLFNSLLNYLHSTINLERDQPWASLGVRFLAIREWTNYPIVISVDDLGDGFSIMAQSDRQVDPHRLIRYMEVAIQSLIYALRNSVRTPALSLTIIPEDELHDLIAQFNDTQVDIPLDGRIQHLFEQKAQETPDALAIVDEDQSLSYSELNRGANQLAHYLIDQGAEPNEYVPVLMRRSLHMVLTQLAILKSGGVYVPLDLNLPADRQRFMMRDCGARRALFEGRVPAGYEDLQIQWISYADNKFGGYPTGNPQLRLSTPPPAYVMYTSGSSGTPKGVIVPHLGVIRLVVNARWIRFKSSDVIAHCSNPAFDAATFEIWGALLNGASILIVPQEAVLDRERFIRTVKQGHVSVVFLTTALFNQHATASPRIFAGLRYLLIGGEAADATVVRSVLQHGPPRNLLNAYGPTETTTFATTYPVSSVADNTISLSIGRPITNTQIYILDGELRPVPVGVTGQIYIGGQGVALGYLNQPELTSARFIADPYSSDSKARLYKSGDLGRWSADGNIEFLGRDDQQVKIRGFRIELGEIESQLACYAPVKDVVVVAREEASGESRLVAYITKRNGMDLDLADLRGQISAALPEYMIPSAFVTLERLPLTANGKLDRRALPAPDLCAYTVRQYEPPRGAVEITIAAVWQRLLGVERVGRDDHFFELGGHSLTALKLLGAITQSLECSLKVADIYANPTIRLLAARIDSDSANDERIQMSSEARLDIGIIALPGRSRAPAQAIMLTGGTGFVGRFLLAQLLRDTDATIHCLVRARSESEGAARVKTTLVKWDLWSEDAGQRIIAVPGDLRLPQLGIEERTYQSLASTIDSIYHCATSMNHLETYAMARSANVESVTEVLKLASCKRPKVINHISTLDVFSPHTTDQVRVVDESTSIDQEHHRNSQGYAASKWISEALFLMGSKRGFACNIFRLGLVWADSQRGRYDELQHEYRVMESCLLSGCAIERYRYALPPTPVDYVARAIVFLANRHHVGGKVFHISSSRQPIECVFERCNETLGTSLRLMSHYEWLMEVKRRHEAGEELPIVPLAQFAFSMDQAAFDEFQRRARASGMTIDCSRTHRELEHAGIVAPALDDDLLRMTLRSMWDREASIRATYQSPDDFEEHAEIPFPSGNRDEGTITSSTSLGLDN